MSRIRRVRPAHRFSVRDRGRRIVHERSIVFRGRSRFYECPLCEARTLVRWKEVDFVPSDDPWPYGPPPSPFPEALKRRFDAVEVEERAYPFDFYCQSCGAPVRLMFWNGERFMGGPWYPEVFWVLETAEGG